MQNDSQPLAYPLVKAIRVEYSPDRSDKTLLLMLEDFVEGQVTTARIRMSINQLASMSCRAHKNKSGRSHGGPVTVYATTRK